MKVLTIFGTRPEAIKLAPVIREIRRRSLEQRSGGAREQGGGGAGEPGRTHLRTPAPMHPSPEGGLRSVVCVTAQHRQMLDQVLRLFEIVPDYDLNVMEDNQSPTQVASAVLSRLEPILQTERPDWVLVQGDTTTVAAASLAAFYARVKVGHVEAGLRTHDKWQPFPEEINRRVAGIIADLHFAPTQRARQNLLREGVPDERIVVTGNPVIDALLWATRKPAPPQVTALLHQPSVKNQKFQRFQKFLKDQRFQRHEMSSGPSGSSGTSGSSGASETPTRLILVTAHRRENFGEPLRNICQALRQIATAYPNVRIVYPVHLNPNVWEPAHEHLDGMANITLLPPLDYLPLVHLLKHSYLVLTDSGGLQEEAPSLGVPVLVLRQVTERPEAVEAGTVRVVGTESHRIVTEVNRLLDDPLAYRAMAQATNPYGDGQASQRIVATLLGESVEPYHSPNVSPAATSSSP